ncbi:hypothetical protein JCM1393_11340 [Clostridium carnis]
MKGNNDIFVKVNYKTIGELKSLIIDKELNLSKNEKYILCTGKYNKDGWTFIFKANSISEAEELINRNSFKNRMLKRASLIENNIHILEREQIHIPAWI